MKSYSLSVGVLGAVVVLLWGLGSSLVVSKVAPLQENTSCAGRCNQTGTIPGAPCQCNKPCVTFGDCCPDYEDVCSVLEPITNEEIASLTEELYDLEGPNNAYRYIRINSSRIEGFSRTGISPLDFLIVDPAAYELDTVKKLIALFDNYSPQTCTEEIFTPEQQQELDDFIDAVLATPIMQRTQQFLASKELPNGRDTFVQIWTDQYSRCSNGTQGSSGLEKVMMGELNGSGVSLFHNWIFFAYEEANGNIAYNSQGQTAFVEFGDKGALIELAFKWHGNTLPSVPLYVGLSPELELALNTIAFFARPNSRCPVSLNGNTIQIQTYDILFEGMKYVASAYPELFV